MFYSLWQIRRIAAQRLDRLTCDHTDATATATRVPRMNMEGSS